MKVRVYSKGELYLKGVKFYSIGDLAVGNELKNAERIISEYEAKEIEDINNALELFNCNLYIENEVSFQNWTEEYKLKLQKKCKQIRRDLGHYFSKINKENIVGIGKSITWIYKEDFLSVFYRYGLNNRIDDEVFNRLLLEGVFQVEEVCRHKHLVAFYDVVIYNAILSDSRNAELFLDYFVVKSQESRVKKFYRPKSLMQSDILELIESYIESEEANLNYLRLIVRIHNTGEFSVTDELKWKAKKRSAEKEAMYFEKSNGMTLEYKVVLEKDLSEPVISKSEGLVSTIKFDKTWLESNLDYPTILQNFIWLFSFIDINGRITFLSHPADKSPIENIFGLKSERDYPTGAGFGKATLS